MAGDIPKNLFLGGGDSPIYLRHKDNFQKQFDKQKFHIGEALSLLPLPSLRCKLINAYFVLVFLAYFGGCLCG